MKHCDTSTGKIYGCEEGSWGWYHEMGHIVFDKNYSWMLMIKQYVFEGWMFFMMVSIVYRPLFSITVALWGIYIFIMLYEEHFCNQYADFHHFKDPRSQS